MPYISVCVPTMRVGGLDVLFEGLKHQTFTDFELVLSDGLYKYRKDIVAEKSKDVSFSVKHVEPIDNPFPLNAFCRYANTALVHADCELVVFLTDYTWIPAASLDKHQQFYQQSPNIGYFCPHQYTELPKINSAFPCYDRPDTDKYVADIELGKLDPVMWSLFEKPYVSGDSLAVDPIMGGADPKLHLPPGPINGAFHGKHESIGLKHLLDVNGWDEDLDGAHPYQDSDLQDRLEARLGLRWHLDP